MEVNVRLTFDVSSQLANILGVLLPSTKAQQVIAQQEREKQTEVSHTIVDDTLSPQQVQVTEHSEHQEVDLLTVQNKVSELVRSGKKPQVSAILQNYGVTGYSQLKGEELTKFYNEINEL